MNLLISTIPQTVFQLEHATVIQESSYLRSYPYLLRYFASKERLDVDDLVCGSHMVYGWMPTVLELHWDKVGIDDERIEDLLNQARDKRELSDSQLAVLAKLINNSLVGASKLLHFVAPDAFPIWDSKIFSFVFQTKPYNGSVNNIGRYREYIELLGALMMDLRFPDFYESVKRKVGYEISELRALELIMFVNAPKFP